MLNKKYEDLEEKYKQLASCHKCIAEDPDAIGSPPAKKAKIHSDSEENCMDPVIKLPEPFVNDVFKLLTADELLGVMEVSSTWSDFIKVRSALMDKIVFKPNLKRCEHPMARKIFTEESPRYYKHLCSTPVLRKKYYTTFEVYPISRYASTLETLHVKYSYAKNYGCDEMNSQISMPARNFPKLRKLKFDICNDLKLLDCTFPSLTHLQLFMENETDAIYYSYLWVEELISSLSELQVLVLNLGCFDLESEELVELEEIFLTFSQNRSKLKSLSSDNYFPNVIFKHQLSLEKLELRYVSEDQV